MIDFPAPPVAVPSGQMVRWSVAGSTSVTIGNAMSNTAVSTLTTGAMSQTFSRPLGNTAASIEWSGFTLNVPTGAEIQSIIPVGVVSTSTPNTFCTLNGNAEQIFGSVPGTPVTDLEVFGDSLGDSLSVIQAATMQATQDQSEFDDWFPPDVFNMSFVGLAVYLTIPPNWLRPPIVTINIGNTTPYPTPNL